jgi:ribonuclease-3
LKRLLSGNHQDLKGAVEDAARLYDLIGYRFVNQSLLIQALKHRSYLPFTNEQRVDSNERLELLGDAVLGLVVTEHLYRRYPKKEEGDLTTMKSLMVSRKILAHSARRIGLGDFVLLSQAEERSGGRNRTSILADVFESLVGAIYLDGGLASARAFVHRHLLSRMDDIVGQEQHRNYKSLLLEYAQARNLGAPVYIVVAEHGPDHDKTFTVEVQIQDETVGIGTGNSKKKAEQQAAKSALDKLMVV